MWKEEGELREQHPRASWVGHRAQAQAGDRLAGVQHQPSGTGGGQLGGDRGGWGRQEGDNGRLEGFDIVHE